MARYASTIEWRMCEDDQEWAAARTAALVTGPKRPVHRTGQSRPRQGWITAALLAVLLPACIAGYRLARSADQEMDRVEAELHNAVSAENWAQQHTPKTLANAKADPAWSQALFASAADAITQTGGITVSRMEVRGGQALVQVVVTQPDKPWLPAPYRQTRAYRETAQGWLRTAPGGDFWQPVDVVTAGRFRLVYGRRDAAAVLAAAREIEAIDDAVRGALGLPLTDATVTIRVATDIPPDIDPAHPPVDGTEWRVPSPALLALPLDLGEDEALRQLLRSLLAQIALNEAVISQPSQCAWTYLHRGLNQWLVWEQSGLPSPSRWSAGLFITGWLAQGTPPQLAMLIEPGNACVHNAYTPVAAGSQDSIVGTAATVVDYAMSAYGRGRLPALIDGMQRYDTWEELIPAVFGVSAADFETGWQKYVYKEKAYPEGVR